MSQFLVVYRRSTGSLLEFRDMGEDMERALAERFSREEQEKDDPDVEVVLLGASSREALMRTHSRYFKTASELVQAIGERLSK
jgi:hypothetical protein